MGFISVIEMTALLKFEIPVLSNVSNYFLYFISHDATQIILTCISLILSVKSGSVSHRHLSHLEAYKEDVQSNLS